MASSCVADTSWVYALLDDADEFHHRAVADAKTLDEVQVPVSAMVETLALVRVRGRRQGLSPAKALALTRIAVASLEKRSNIRLGTPPHDHAAALRIWDHHPGLTYADAAIIAAARRQAVDLRTFDRRQQSAHRSGKP